MVVTCGLTVIDAPVSPFHQMALPVEHTALIVVFSPAQIFAFVVESVGLTGKGLTVKLTGAELPDSHSTTVLEEVHVA